MACDLDAILELPNGNAIQSVQGGGAGQPIVQWVSLFRTIQADGMRHP